MSTEERLNFARSLLEGDEKVSTKALIDAPTLAAYFGCTVKTLRERELRGVIPTGVKLGRSKVWRVVDIRQSIAKLMQKSHLINQGRPC